MHMQAKKLPGLKIGRFNLPTPIIQGGMGVGISLSGLASAVANEGGVGVISSVGLGLLFSEEQLNYRKANMHFLRHEIRKARQMTNGVIGLNIMVALSDFDNMLQIAIEEEVDVVFMGAGLPLRFPKNYTPEMIRNFKTYFVPIVSSARAAQLIFQYWGKTFGRIPEAVVVEGPKAGGHLGFKREQIDDPQFQLEKLIPEVVDTVKVFEERFEREIPVIAAGGIFSGADILKFLELGASGVQMATRFVATHECDASEDFKNAYVQSKKEDIVIIDSPVGLPGRAIKNSFLQEVKEGQKKPFKCSWKCLKTCDFRTTPYCIADALANAQRGMLEKGFTFAGSNAYKVDKIVSVNELFLTLEKEYLQAVKARQPQAVY
ncbi:2-nitropropane dioxygenase NPD [Caldithrix abyssi DSM 13497]|uniref:2-nitropropane dioxygenase NPD n=2 Tax=Caldithrix abyssi DSM 13497 TaxID=880073 RepID=H1XX54_CALAY|nr:nitronate monooxygenase family protein [Caldithrix abyssi]EHO40791.1 2-nitropropane dioxygenase NPD [Caldithrix abyssi DSM 13497]